MNPYEEQATRQLRNWEAEMQAHPSFSGKVSKNLQDRINRAIPEKVHNVITTSIREMTRGVFYGAGFLNPSPLEKASLREREHSVRGRSRFYRHEATAEGAVTGAGGSLLGREYCHPWLALQM